jgi:hypothetical protein
MFHLYQILFGMLNELSLMNNIQLISPRSSCFTMEMNRQDPIPLRVTEVHSDTSSGASKDPEITGHDVFKTNVTQYQTLS